MGPLRRATVGILLIAVIAAVATVSCGGPRERAAVTDEQTEGTTAQGPASATGPGGATTEPTPVPGPAPAPAVTPEVVRQEGRLTIKPAFGFTWVGPNLLRTSDGLVDVGRGTWFPAEGLGQSVVGSPDGTAVAYVRGYTIVIRRLRDGSETEYGLTPSEFGMTASVRSWSPDGRYVIGEVNGPLSLKTPGPAAGSRSWSFRVWVIDVEAGRLTEADLGGQLTEVQWSPAGDRTASRRFHEETWSSDWVEFDPATAAEMAVFPFRDRSDPRVTWNEAGRLEVRLPGEGGLRVEPYDPVRKMSFEGILAQDWFAATELRFWTEGDELAFSLDLRPALEQAGIPVMEWLFVYPYWSPDGRYVLLEGDTSDLNGQSEHCWFLGVVDVSARAVRFLPATKEAAGEWHERTMIERGTRWSGNVALVPSLIADKQLAVLDVTTVTRTVLATGADFLRAWRTEKGIIYMAAGEVGLVDATGARHILLTAPEGETFADHAPSPTGRYLAVARTTNPDWIVDRPTLGDGIVTIEVLDLKSIR